MITPILHQLAATKAGAFQWTLDSIGFITVFSPTRFPLGQIDDDGRPLGGKKRKKRDPFRTIEEAGKYFTLTLKQKRQQPKQTED